MSKIFEIVASLCVALIVVFAISTSAEAQRHHGGGFRGGHFGGAHIGRHYGGAHIGRHYGGAHIGRHYGGARLGRYYGGARVGSRYYRGGYHGRYYGRGYRSYGGHGYRYGGYWPFWGWGLAGGALVAAWPYYYYGNGYYDEAPAYDSDVAYCMRRFKSYDPVSRTYLGYDGYRHPCP